MRTGHSTSHLRLFATYRPSSLLHSTLQQKHVSSSAEATPTKGPLATAQPLWYPQSPPTRPPPSQQQRGPGGAHWWRLRLLPRLQCQARSPTGRQSQAWGMPASLLISTCFWSRQPWPCLVTRNSSAASEDVPHEAVGPAQGPLPVRRAPRRRSRQKQRGAQGCSARRLENLADSWTRRWSVNLFHSSKNHR